MTTCVPPLLKTWTVDEEGHPASPEEVWEELCHRIEWRDFFLRVATSSGPPAGGVPADEEASKAWDWTKNRVRAEWAAKRSTPATRRLIGAMERDQRLAVREIPLIMPAAEEILPFVGQTRRDRLLYDYDFAEIERRLLSMGTRVPYDAPSLPPFMRVLSEIPSKVTLPPSALDGLHLLADPPKAAGPQMRSSKAAMHAVTDEIRKAASRVEIQLPQPDTLRLGRVERAIRFGALYGMPGGIGLQRNQTEVTEEEQERE